MSNTNAYGKPTLDNLARLLRDKSRWPEDFIWDYRTPDNCAVGLAVAVGWANNYSIGEMRRAFRIKEATAEKIFVDLGGYVSGLANVVTFVDIQPEHVANAIAKHIRRKV